MQYPDIVIDQRIQRDHSTACRSGHMPPSGQRIKDKRNGKRRQNAQQKVGRGQRQQRGIRAAARPFQLQPANGSGDQRQQQLHRPGKTRPAPEEV